MSEIALTSTAFAHAARTSGGRQSPTQYTDRSGYYPDFYGDFYNSGYVGSFLATYYPNATAADGMGLASAWYSGNVGAYEAIANEFTAYLYAGNYTLFYGEYPGNSLLQTDMAVRGLTMAQNFCMDVARTYTFGAFTAATFGLGGVSTVGGIELGVPSLNAMFRFTVADGLATAQVSAPVVGQAVQAEGSQLAGITNPIPTTLARIIPGNVNPATLGRPGALDVFVTDAEGIAGMNPQQISEYLTIPYSPTYTIYQFATPAEGLASPVFRSDPGFVGGGLTMGGAPEFVMPNMSISSDWLRILVGQ